MQRNSIFKLALSLIVVLLLGACEMIPSQTSEWDMPSDGRTPPSATLPSTPPATPAVPGMSPTATQTGSKNKVALLLPLTGRGSDAGQAMLNAAQLAMFDLGANSFELMPQDTGPGAAQAATAAVQNGAQLILGPLFAEDAKAVSPVALQSGISLVSFSTDTSAANANTFILGFLPQSQVARIIDYAASKGLSRIALIAPRDQYGNAISVSFDATLRQRGMTNAGVLRYDGTPNLDEVRNLAATKSFDAVLIGANASQSSSIAQALPANIQKLGTGLWDQANAAQNPGLVGAWYAASSPKLRQKFESNYRNTYGATPPRLASLAYDAAALAVVLSKQNQGFGRAALLNPNGFAGVDGIFRFLPDGLNDRGLSVLQIGTSGATIVQDAPATFR